MKYLDYFYEISKIKRIPSDEGEMADYLVRFANKRNLKYIRDELNNVIIYKSADTYIDSSIALQSHIDMVCEKKENSSHDFNKDPLKLIVDGDYIKADGTTLGADNGIGVAYMLSILDNEQLNVNLECIFTTQEETTMNGARNIDVTNIKSTKIISFDNFSEEEMWISSSLSKEWVCSKKIETFIAKGDIYTIELKKCLGGHSGIDIWDKSRLNAIKEVVNILKQIDDLNIIDIKGGSATNVIPRECSCTFITNNKETLDILKKYKIDKEQGEYTFSLVKCENECTAIKSTDSIINFLDRFKNGAIDLDINGNVVVSGNMGKIEIKDNNVLFIFSMRTNINKESITKSIEDNIIYNDLEIVHYDEMKGYIQNENSDLINLISKEYRDFYGKDIKKVKVQACLECGFFAEKIKNLEYISIAPNIENAHSPSERVSISSADKMYDFITKVLLKMK